MNLNVLFKIMSAKSILALKDVFDTYSKIALVLGVLLVVLGAAGGIAYQSYLPIQNLWARILLMLIGAFIVVFSFSKNETKTELSSADIEKLGIKIRSPRANDKIRGKIRVVVEASKAMPEGYELHVLRGYPHENGFVPNAKAQKTTNQLEWIVEEFDIAGVKDDVRRIEAWLVGINGRALLENWQVNHRVLVGANGSLKGIKEKAIGLPESQVNWLPAIKVNWLPAIQTKTTDMHRCDSISVTKDS